MAFNRVRRFYKVYFMSQIMRYDGKTIDPVYIHSRTVKASSMRFPTEQPTESDFGKGNSAELFLKSLLNEDIWQLNHQKQFRDS